jgi:hypothetical protein
MARSLSIQQREKQQEISRLKDTVRELKIRSQNTKYSAVEHKKYLDQYNLYNKKLISSESDLIKINGALSVELRNSKKASGVAAVKKIEDKYKELNKQLSYQLDPNSQTAKDIKAKLAALPEEYRVALSDAKGIQFSLAAAKTIFAKIPLPIYSKVTPKPTPTLSVGVTPKPTPTLSVGVTPKPTPTLSVGVTPKPTPTLSVGVTPSGTPVGTTLKPQALETLLAKTDFWYDLPDYIFNTVPGLGDILVQAVSEGWSDEKFLAKTQTTSWWQKNSSNIRTRIIDKAKYDELKAAGEDVSKTDYALYLTKQMNTVKAKAQEIAGVTLTDEQAQNVAGKIYNGFLDDDPSAINALIVPFIGKVNSIAGTGTTGQNIGGYSGQALQNYQRLQEIAKANGFTVKDILPNISTANTNGDLETAVLQQIAAGTIDINRIAQDARILAAKNQPKYVQDLLNQGYDLNGVYGNYINLMSQYFDIDPTTIKATDPLLAKVFTDTGGMKFADFESLLRTDARFKGTKQAGQEGNTRQSIADRALALGVNLSDTEIDDVVNNALSLGVSASSSLVDGLIRAKFTYAPGKTLGGASGNALSDLKSTAAANGLNFDTSFGKDAQTWIAKILQGESPETFKNIIRKIAGSGLPDNVKSLLDLGVNLDTIYSPYKNIMASTLEINPETINLNDNTLRSAIGPDKEMNLYDWERSLKKDDRWQYTKSARNEVSTAALGVLKDFGFQG